MSPETINGLYAIAGAVVGAIIAGLFAIYIAKRSRDTKRLVLSLAPPSRLLVIHDAVKKDVEITVSGHPVEDLTLSEFYLSNAGNKSVGPLKFPASLPGGCVIFSTEVIDQRTKAKRPGATLWPEDESSFTVELDYLNPGEEVSIRTIFSGRSSDWDIQLRQPDLEVIQRATPAVGYSDVVVEEVFRAISHIPLMQAYLRLVLPAFRRFESEKGKLGSR